MIYSSLEFYKKLHKNDQYSFSPVKKGATEYGEKLSLGFSTFGLKMYYMQGEWKGMPSEKKLEWIKFINSFQKNKVGLPKNSYVDEVVFDFYRKSSPKQVAKDIIKKIANISSKYNLDTNKIKFQKAVNAETKQAISSLHQVEEKNLKKYDSEFNTPENIANYLHSLNWEMPWTSGAQYASLCVYSKIDSLSNVETLMKFADQLVDSETGSYFKGTPNHSREIINGAMKMISGFDWIDLDIHYPKKLIDYCLSNSPVTEGCDVVDFIYVLYKCTKQSNHRKQEVLNTMDKAVEKISDLYHSNYGGFSYFKNMSQTHYYGVPISYGINEPDIHGTLLCVWGLMMVLDANDSLDTNFRIIKP